MATSDRFTRTSTIANYDLPDGESGGTQDPTTRLSNIVPSDSTEDNERLAFMRIEGENIQAMFDDIKNLWPADQGPMQELLDALSGNGVADSGYTKFCITGLQDSRAEKMQIMQTCGDNLIATFTGREPHILGVQGYLIFDYQSSNSWYHAFMNAYEYYLRASRMAKYHCKMRLVFPDFQQLVGYMINLNTSHNSESDTIVPFSFSMLVVDKTPAHALYIPEASSTSAQTTTQTEETKEGEEETVTVDGVDVPKSVADQLPSKEDYDNYNALKDRVDNGEELSEDEAQQFQDLTDKINNQGPAQWSYDTAERQQLTDKEANGTITQEEADELMDNRERRYAILTQKKSYSSLTADEQTELDQLEKVAAPQVMYRNLQDKKSAGAEMTEYEKIKLKQLDQDLADSNAAKNSPTSDLASNFYQVCENPDSPGATAVETAKDKKGDTSYTTPTTPPDPKLASEQTKKATKGTVVPGTYSASVIKSTSTYLLTHPDIRTTINTKIATLNKALQLPAPGVDYIQNSDSIRAVNNMLSMGAQLYQAYTNLYSGTNSSSLVITSRTYIDTNQTTFMNYTVPTAQQMWSKMVLDSNGNYVRA